MMIVLLKNKERKEKNKMKTKDSYKEYIDETNPQIIIAEGSKICTVSAEEHRILNKAFDILWDMCAFVGYDDYFSLKVEKENGEEYTLDDEAEGMNLIHAVDFLENFYRKGV